MIGQIHNNPGRERILRRHSDCGGAVAAGLSRVSRLDPLALPLRFLAPDAGADQRLRIVELHRERVVLRRAVSGIRMAVNVPVGGFLGVAVRVVPADGATPSVVCISLEHRDPGLSVPLYSAPDHDDVIAEWQLWGRVLGVPLLVADGTGILREPFRRIGAVRVNTVAPRRRRHNAVSRRRPVFLMRRPPGVPGATPAVHRGEDEIIARC